MRASRRHRRMTLRTRVAYAAGSLRREDTATTLGAGGLFIATDEPLDEGTALRVRFRLPGGHCEHALDGRVVWTHRQRPGDGAPQSSGMGVAFTQPAARLAAELEAFARAAGGEPTPLD